jgi:tape measure domain-containing protein
MTLAEANVKFKSEGADKVKSDANEVANSLKKVAMAEMASAGAAGIAIAAFVALGAAIVKVTKYSAEQAIAFDSNIRGLAAYSESTNSLRAQVARLEEMAKAPGLGFDQLIQGVTRLEAAGFSAKQAEGALKQFGNALALVGGSKTDLEGVALALTQIKSKGVISAEEINQIAERVPQVRQAMKAAFGTASSEEIQKLGITASQFVDGITKSLAKLPRATGGLQNSLDNIDDAFKKAGRTVGAGFFALFEKGPPIFNQLSSSLQNVANFINQVFNTIAQSDMFQQIQRNISSIITSFQKLAPVFAFVFKLIAATVLGVINFITEKIAIFANVLSMIFTNPIAFIKAEFQALGQQIPAIFTNILSATLSKLRTVASFIDKYAGTKFAEKIPVVAEVKVQGATAGQKALKAAFDVATGGSKGLFGIVTDAAKAFGQIYDLKPAASPLDKIKTGGKKPEVPDDPKQKDDKEKKKKQDKKSESLLSLIVQNTQKANELTLRNMTYGGGVLASQGISQVQMANYRSVASPRINATNDISRGVKKEVNATIGSNFLNFSPRRS